ncbi:MAG: hypothetical protein A3K60_06590 [Euryarchaeota archaeon RBG_19FT_COMBO_56_21]|nr:MAG: hypothetical protein A3K60_06590 [Euryarchaeota archaeon RBG_19FT_COMBO_56_21]
MASKWVKAVFLIVIGIVILLYADRLVDDLRAAIEPNFDVVFEGTWDLLTILLWILVAWLFVDAVLTIVLSFSEERYGLADVMKHLATIERKLGISTVKEVRKPEEEPLEEPVTTGPPVEEEPPPP